MSSNAKDDVDRLFECFKCGISPPQSAVRERKRSKSKLSEKDKLSGASSTPSPGSVSQQKKKTATDSLLSQGNIGLASDNANHVGLGPARQISPVVFYGSPHGVPAKRPISLLRLLHEIRIDLAEEQKSNLRPEEEWSTFPRQNEAMNYAKEHPHVFVFSYQDHHSGQRRFLVSTYKEFWRRYKNMESKFRHHYEVIQEGLPCHLYFDLEFNKIENEDRDGDQMVDLLISIILEALLEKYFIQGNHDWIVELDSSTVEKFSRHLIIRIPNRAFKDNSHAGAFVSEICSRILNARSTDGKFEKLFVRKDSSSAESPSQLFVDSAVYSRNRCFRLAFSSKAGKSSVLLPTGRFKCKDMCEEDMFMASLICNMDSDCEKLLVCEMGLACARTLHFDTEVNYNLRSRTPQNFSSSGCPKDASVSFEGCKSPFPALDNFIESIASVGSISGKIRTWYWFSEYGLIVYSMSRNRYCERIGRQHKSNHVIYVVDLRRAVYYQKCHDPDCRGYRSPSRLIPRGTIPDQLHFYDSVEMVNQMGLTNSALQYQFVKNDCQDVLIYNEKHDTEGYSQDAWWFEALKVADGIEEMQRTFELSNIEKNDGDDDNWWIAVERTASQAELLQFG